MLIRPWQAGDHDGLFPLIAAYIEETPEYEYVLNRHNTIVLFSIGLASGLSTLAIADDRMVGFTNWIRSPLMYRTPVCFGFGTYVAPEYRRQGVAKQLHDASAQLAAKAGYVQCERVSNGGMGEPMLERDGWALESTRRMYRRAL